MQVVDAHLMTLALLQLQVYLSAQAHGHTSRQTGVNKQAKMATYRVDILISLFSTQNFSALTQYSPRSGSGLSEGREPPKPAVNF